MASPSFEDKEFGGFSTPADALLDGFFDLSFSDLQDPPDASDSSNGSNFFDDLSTGSTTNDNFLFDTTPLAAPIPQYGASNSWRGESWRNHKAPPVPQSQKLVHRLRPEGVGISNSELLTLEGKTRSSRSRLLSSSPPATPPTTPYQRSSRPSTPSSPTRRVHRVNKSSVKQNTLSFPNMAQLSDCLSRQDSSSINDWNDRFQSLNNRNPFPLSPPASAKAPQHSFPEFPASQVDSLFTPISPPSASFDQSASGNHSRSRSGNYPSLSLSNPTPWQTPASTLDIPQLDVWGDNSTNGFGPCNDGMVFSPTTFPSNKFGPLDPSFGNSGLMIQCGPFDDFGFLSNNSNIFSDSKLNSSTTAMTEEDDDDKDFGDISPRSTRPRGLHLTTTSRSPSPSAIAARRRRSSGPSTSSASGTQAPRTPRTPKTPGSRGGSGSMGFVNFTPHDHQKILTGVAPSGSSKTKARREREASEKRRKLSEVAEKAVREAGGDLERLRMEGLI